MVHILESGLWKTEILAVSKLCLYVENAWNKHWTAASPGLKSLQARIGRTMSIIHPSMRGDSRGTKPVFCMGRIHGRAIDFERGRRRRGQESRLEGRVSSDRHGYNCRRWRLKRSWNWRWDRRNVLRERISAN